MATGGPPTDDELLALMRDVQQREQAAAAAKAATREAEESAVEGPARERAGEPCPYCGELALELTDCATCGTDGCLPRDDWYPGDGDPCITRCARCGNHVHVGCASRDATGNPVCCTARWADTGWGTQ